MNWKDIWKWNLHRIKILSQGVYDVVPRQALYTTGGGLSGEKGRGWCRRRCERQSWKSKPAAHWPLRQQGAWIKWAKVRERGVSWKDIWKWNAHWIKILSQGVYDVLQSQAVYASGGGLLG